MAETPQTEEERFAAETSSYHVPGSPAEAPKGGTDAAGNAPAGSNADDAATKAAAAAAAADAGDQDGETDASRAAAADGTKAATEPKAGEGEGGAEAEPPPEGELPAWMKKRLERSTIKETSAETRAREAEEKAQRLEEENAALKARAPTKEPDPDDFETTADYEAAKVEWKKAKEAPAPKPAAPKAEAHPLGITQEMLADGVSTLSTALPPTVVARLKDPEQVKHFPASVLLEVAEESDKETQTAMARFVIANQKRMEAINKMAPRQQAPAFIRAFNESDPIKAKKKSAAPEPIEPVGTNSGRDEQTALPSLSSASYAEFERVMNEADTKTGRRPY